MQSTNITGRRHRGAAFTAATAAAVLLALWALTALPAGAAESNDWPYDFDTGPCGTPPPPEPAQASGGEAFVGMAAPVTPQRRTEKKNPPRPPVIAVKLRAGDPIDWNTDPNDMNNLLKWMQAEMDVNFSWEVKPLSDVNLEGETAPVLYRTGHLPFSFSESERQRLRQYVMRGGLIIFDTCWGMEGFAESVRREMAEIFPEHPLKPLALDHPVYHAYYQDAGMVQFTPFSGGHTAPAELEGIEIGCRLGVIFSPHDLSCGWDMHTNKIEGGSWIETQDALRLGANIISYATATRDMDASLAHAKAYVDDSPTTAHRFRIGQLIHEGDWQPDRAALQNLLETVGEKTAIQISFATEGVEADFGSLSRFPFLYVTGHDDFTWDQDQVAAIRRYLANGGFIFADACCGRQAFDVAFRREIAKVLGEESGNLGWLRANHPIYTIHNDIERVRFTEAAHQRSRHVQGDQRPRLMGATVDGRLAVVYSPLALNVGWRVSPVPYSVGYAPESALDLGVNVVMYAMTQ